jgi:GTP-binding protein
MSDLSIPEAEFVTSCPSLATAPRPPLPEIAFAGRSNVGKSSLINSLLNRRKLALTSRTPGKTRLLNYYRIGKNLCYFVDLPGYGYARVPGETKGQWSRALEDYVGQSEQLRLVVLLLDMRQGVMPLDEQMVDALNIYRRTWLAVLTKSDKLTRGERRKAETDLQDRLTARGAIAIIPYSATSHEGRDALWQAAKTVLTSRINDK